MSFTGDLGKLGQLASNLQKLASIPARMAKPAAEVIDILIREEFETSTDPYGNGWEALMQSTVDRKRGDDRILRRTDLTLETLKVSPRAGAGITIEIEDYMGFHVSGTRDHVARPPLPTNVMPASWRRELDRVRDAMFQKALAS